MNIALIWAQGGPSSWDGNSYKAGIGGSESMMIFYANALARRGETVVCYTHNAHPSTIEGVRWEDMANVQPRAFDVVVSVRDPRVLELFTAPVKALLCNDQRCDSLHDVVQRGHCNMVITISEHQKQRYQRQHPIDEGYYLVSSAGVRLDDYLVPLPKDRTVLYTSTPERGLIYMADIWPMILEQVPDVKLVVTSGFQLYGWDDEQCRKYSAAIYRGVKALPSCEYVGPIPREDLVALQRKAALLAYPTNYDEMCCISALEAAAAYTPIVTTARAALNERVVHGETGYLVGGIPGSANYNTEFVDYCVQILTNRDLSVTMGIKGHKIVTNHAYDEQAYRWVCRFRETLSAEADNTNRKAPSG